MKLKDIPAPVWYLGAAAIVAAVAWSYLKRGAAAAANAVNPLSDTNAAITLANDATKAVTGNDSSFGGAVYDFFHPQVNADARAPVTITKTALGHPNDVNANANPGPSP